MSNAASSVVEHRVCDDSASLTNKPRTLEQTGIPLRVLEALVIKHLQQATDLDVVSLSRQLGLPGNLVEQIIQKQKAEALVEVRSDGRFNSAMRFGLTQKGMILAQHELQRDGYLGPAPISLDHYRQLVISQSSKQEPVTPEILRQGLRDVYFVRRYCWACWTSPELRPSHFYLWASGHR